MKTLLMLLAIAVFTTGAIAQPIDPDMDGMGIYFEPDGALIPCAHTGGGIAAITAYLLITRPSHGEVVAWEARIVSEVDAFSAGSWVLANGGTNVGEGDDYIVGLGANPIGVTGQAVILATRDMVFFGMPTDFALFYLGGVPGSLSFPDGTPGYAADLGLFVPGQVWHGSLDEPVASVNDSSICDTVANENMAWGHVKSLY